MIRNKKLRILLYILLPGILFYLAWPPRDLFFLSFIALIPLFLLEKEIKNTARFGLLTYLSLLVFNILTTWWVWYASPGGCITMLLANSGLMLIPFYAYRKSKGAVGQGKALLLFACLWLAYEYLHLNWEITWPWLVLGNVFAKHNFTVQWYEFTGAMGGSLWVLITNILFLKVVESKRIKTIGRAILTIVIPIALSLFILQGVPTQGIENDEVLLVQPNVDPYKKFNPDTKVSNLIRMLEMAEKEVTLSTKYVVMPETAVVEYIDEDHPYTHQSMRLLKQFVQRHPHLHLITGVSSYNFYSKGEKPSPTARKTTQGDAYESYNSAVEVDRNGELTWHHKMKLVPGPEKMPYPQLFGFLEHFSIDLGGVVGSLGSDDVPIVFDAGDNPDVGALICYESVFPELVSGFVQRGANYLFVITNDGWWRDTDGYKQHMYYAGLRAIETRRDVMRSANTGISCYINKRGQIQERTKWWEATVLKVNAYRNEKLTFYSKAGDYIGGLASFIGVFFMLSIFVKTKTQKLNKVI